VHRKTEGASGVCGGGRLGSVKKWLSPNHTLTFSRLQCRFIYRRHQVKSFNLNPQVPSPRDRLHLIERLLASAYPFLFQQHITNRQL
jgi:hypothetical protein